MYCRSSIQSLFNMMNSVELMSAFHILLVYFYVKDCQSCHSDCFLHCLELNYGKAAVAALESNHPKIFSDLQNLSTRNSPSVFPYLVKLNNNGSYHGLREPIRKLENHYPELKIY